jgi:hypothetical protein
MANTLFGGFHPVDALRVRARPYPVASGYGTALYRGDVVVLMTTGAVEAATAGDADLIVGVVKEVEYFVSGALYRDTYLPASTTYSPTTLWPGNTRSASRVWVYDDPNTEYWACCASHAGTDTVGEVLSARGANMDLVATAGNTVYRQSGHQLDGNPIAGAAQFRILEARRVVGNDMASANWQARVAINEGFHAFHSSAGI